MVQLSKIAGALLYTPPPLPLSAVLFPSMELLLNLADVADAELYTPAPSGVYKSEEIVEFWVIIIYVKICDGQSRICGENSPLHFLHYCLR